MVTADPERTLVEALHETLLGLMGRLDLEDLLADIVQRAADLVGTEHGYVYLLEPGEAEMEVRVGLGFHRGFIGRRVRSGEGLAGLIWERGSPVLVQDYASWEGRVELPGYDALRAVVGVPLGHDGAVVGVLALSRLEEGQGFGELEVEVLTRFGELASVAIANARLHADLQRSEQHYRTLFEAAQDGILLLEGETVVDCNRAAAALFAGAREEIVGRPVGVLFPERQPDGTRSVTQGVEYVTRAVGGEPQRFEWWFRRRDGGGFVGEVSLDRVRMGEGSRILVLIHDTTRRKALQRQLLHVQKMEAVGRVAGGVAHDFNNVLAAMMGVAEVASLRAAEGDPLRVYLDEIVEHGERGASLVSQLLSFSEDQPARPEVLALDEVARGVLRMLQRLVGQDVALVTRFGDAPPVRADRGQVERVLVNLVVNARDAMPGGGTVTISTDSGAERSQAVLTVADTGIGMTEEVRAQVFEPFFTTKRAQHGTGLGLATVESIVVQGGGTIEVQSAPGEGTRFVILLPAAEPAPPPVS